MGQHDSNRGTRRAGLADTWQQPPSIPTIGPAAPILPNALSRLWGIAWPAPRIYGRCLRLSGAGPRARRYARRSDPGLQAVAGAHPTALSIHPPRPLGSLY